MRKWALIVVGAVIAFLVSLAGLLYCALYFHYIELPEPSSLFVHYETAEGEQTRRGFGPGTPYTGNLVLGADYFESPYYDYCRITASPGTTLLFSGYSKKGLPFRIRRTPSAAQIGLFTLEEYKSQEGKKHPGTHKGKVLNRHDFQFITPEAPGRYLLQLDIDFLDIRPLKDYSGRWYFFSYQFYLEVI